MRVELPQSGAHGRHEDDNVGSVTAALARSILIRKAILLPKLKAAALFQPEDHVRSSQIRAGAILRTPNSSGRATWARRHIGTVGLQGSTTVEFSRVERCCLLGRSWRCGISPARGATSTLTQHRLYSLLSLAASAARCIASPPRH